VTHDPKGDVFNEYTSLPWEALCREVAKLRVQPLKGEVTVYLQSAVGNENAPKSEDLEASNQRGVRDLNPYHERKAA
jgi:hypothetical protein